MELVRYEAARRGACTWMKNCAAQHIMKQDAVIDRVLGMVRGEVTIVPTEKRAGAVSSSAPPSGSCRNGVIKDASGWSRPTITPASSDVLRE